MTSDLDDLDGDDVTLPAGGDVVAQIRAHAAKVRRGEVPADEEIEVWTPPVEEHEPELESESEPVSRPVAQPLLPNDETVAFSAPPPVIDPVAEMAPVPEMDSVPEMDPVPEMAPVPAPPTGDSLIEGLAPPDSAADFWGPDRRFGTNDNERKTRPPFFSRVPLWFSVVLVACLIVAASVGIALALATTMVPFA